MIVNLALKLFDLAGVVLCAGETIMISAWSGIMGESSPTRKSSSDEWHGVE